MTEHIDTQRIELFIARRLPPGELLKAARHLGVCQPCRDRVAHAARADARIEGLRAELRENTRPGERHLGYEQLEAYVEGRLDAVGREIADNHLAVCPPCAREAQELESFRESLHSPNLPPNTTPGPPPESLWKRVGGLLGTPPRLAWAAAALLVVVFAAGLMSWRRADVPGVANNNVSPAPTAPVVADANANATPTVAETTKPPAHEGANPPATPGPEIARQHPPAEPPNALAPYEAVISRALETQKLTRPPVLKGLEGGPSTLMSGPPSSPASPTTDAPDATFALLSPVGTATLSPRPLFRWQPLNGATSYKVYILDTDFRVVAESGPLTGTSWAPPTALRQGVVYLWQVSAAKDGREISAPAAPASEARFKVLKPSQAREVRRIARERAGAHLTLGIVYAHAGLLDDAEREFRAAISRNQQPSTARKLLQSALAMRR